MIGLIRVSVKYEDQESLLPLLIVEGDGPSLLSRNWLSYSKINWHNIFWLQNNSMNRSVREFLKSLGQVKGYKAKILVDSKATPKYMKARRIPHYYREKVVKELNQLVEKGTLEPVEHSDWASPIVAVLKPDKENEQICG